MITLNTPSTFKENDYEWAVLNLAWWACEEKRELVLGFVELCSTDSSEPIGVEPKRKYTDKIVSNSYLSYTRYVMPACDAIEWYENAIQGIAAYPMEKEEILMISEMQALTDWPSLMLLDNDQNDYPFLSEGWNTRVHSLYPDVQLQGIKAVKSYPGYVKWLSEQFLFDFNNFHEYWGSMHCAFPNPVLRSLNSTRGILENKTETVDIELVTRRGTSLEGLTLIHEEKTHTGTSAMHAIPIRDPFIRIIFGREVGEVTTSVVCTERGLIAREGPYPFLREINFQVGIHSGVKNIEVPAAGKKKPAEIYQVPIVSNDVPKSIHFDERQVEGIPIDQRLREEHYRRKRKKKAIEQGQRWLHGNEQEAKTFLRKRIEAARKRVWVIDPYFAAREFFSFVLAAKTGVDIRIFSSVDALKRNSSIDGASNIEEGWVLFNQLEKSKEQFPNKIEVKLMTGKQPEIHDRFLVVDDNVWFSGISLNQIGERAALLMKVYDPEPVISEIEKVWNNPSRTITLEGWVKQREGENAES
jgi:hypothetical protein